MNETEIRERLFDLAAEAPEGLAVPPRLLGRARRRVALTITSLVVFVLALGAGGIAGVRWLGNSAREPVVQPTHTPVEPSPRPDNTALPKLRRDGEIITSRGRELVAVDPDTGHTRTLVDGDASQGRIGNAAWSPDGRWLAYDIAIQSALWVMNAHEEPRQVAVPAGRWAWSPTDAHLAIMRTSTLRTLDVVHGLTLLDAPTGHETDLGPTLGDVTTGPVWSPDGTRIVYGARGGLIYSVDVEGGDHSLLVRLQGALDSIDAIDWSPDGAHLAIVADAPRPGPHLYLMNADGSGLRLIDDNVGRRWPVPFSGQSAATAWSPDGTRLAYADFSGPDDRELRIWTVSLDEVAPSLVASHTNPVCCQSGGGAVWSPDGSQIAFEIPLDRRETHIGHLIVNADGTGDANHIDELTYLSWRGGWYFCFCYG